MHGVKKGVRLFGHSKVAGIETDMKHPFYKILNTALNKSSELDNLVFKEAQKLKEKGYREQEIYEVLLKLREGLLDDRDIEIAQEAIELFGEYQDS